MGDIYDGAFRTIVNDCRKLIIPVINEVFGESYSGEGRIEFFPNEHFMEQQGIIRAGDRGLLKAEKKKRPKRHSGC